MTNGHLRLMLDDPGDFSLLHQAAFRFANADVPAPILEAARLGRIVALHVSAPWWLAPALFALGQHNALARAAGGLHPSDNLLAFLDDLYVVTVATRARPALVKHGRSGRQRRALHQA